MILMDSRSKPAPQNSRRRWEDRIQRAQELQAQHPNTQDALRFYERVLQFQLQLAEEFNSTLRSQSTLRGQIELRIAIRHFPKLLSLADRSGLGPLSQHARALMEAGEAGWRGIFETALVEARDGSDFLDSFFARACLQPAAENLQLQMPKNDQYGGALCPACDGLPQMSVLRPEGEGASRSLLCSFCLREWPFRRIACPSCGEEDKEKLPRYSAEGHSYMHVEACDTCRRYLKTVDMTIDGRAVPLVDEAAHAVLDVWASDHGYAKIVPNLIGF